MCVHVTDATANITSFALQDLLPANKDDFYRYSGSLTTPTCDEVVTWTVFKDPITISSAQVTIILRLKTLEEGMERLGTAMDENENQLQYRCSSQNGETNICQSQFLKSLSTQIIQQECLRWEILFKVSCSPIYHIYKYSFKNQLRFFYQHS